MIRGKGSTINILQSRFPRKSIEIVLHSAILRTFALSKRVFRCTRPCSKRANVSFVPTTCCLFGCCIRGYLHQLPFEARANAVRSTIISSAWLHILGPSIGVSRCRVCELHQDCSQVCQEGCACTKRIEDSTRLWSSVMCNHCSMRCLSCCRSSKVESPKRFELDRCTKQLAESDEVCWSDQQ